MDKKNIAAHDMHDTPVEGTCLSSEDTEDALCEAHDLMQDLLDARLRRDLKTRIHALYERLDEILQWYSIH